ncbi:hypothetical protein CRS_44070 [Chryseobacterium sp. ON_d1]|nr:hypothetical protein CRS_44070 [Chryseobacterium sp. ON_d1]
MAVIKTNAPNTKLKNKDFTRFSVGIYGCPSSVTGGSKQSIILKVITVEIDITIKLIAKEIRYIFMVSCVQNIIKNYI